MTEIIYLTPADDLQTALDAAPQGAEIHLAAGEYRQKVMLHVPGLTIRGAGADKTRLVYDDYAQKIDELGREYNTFRTYTVAVCADGVTMEDLSIVNDALNPKEKGQEVALSVVADDFTMKNCTLSSTQDTLFNGPLPPDLILRYTNFHREELLRGGEMKQCFENCLIEGSVDFIFGCANAVFENCEIRSLYDGRSCGFVAAPAHSPEQKKGLCFRRCRFTRGDGVQPGSVFLARPWRDYGLAVFEDCTYDVHIAREGFDKWNDTNRDETARFFEAPAVAGRVEWANRPERMS